MTSSSSSPRRAQLGDIVTVQLDLRPENFVPEPLFDTTGRIQLVLGWGNYLPGLHELIKGCTQGDSVKNVSIDAGWGKSRQDLIIRFPKRKILELGVKLRVGSSLRLKGGIQVLVKEIEQDHVVLDANPPLAGTSYSCSFTILDIEDRENSKYQQATFALGCFWGAELAFMRRDGVVGTKVGYSQGITTNPTYYQVCEGNTQHREAVQLIFDTTKVSYQELVQLALERLSQTDTVYDLGSLFDQDATQYKHGIYYHTPEQKTWAQSALETNRRVRRVELLDATTFYDAELQHQQYLYKGGQSARKDAKASIRCYG
jgi:peptide-methionine (S)-S-oxide reductase